MKVIVFIEKCEDGYSALMEYCEKLNCGFSGWGETVEKAINDFLQVCEDVRCLFKKEGKVFPVDLEFDFKYQTPAMLG